MSRNVHISTVVSLFHYHNTAAGTRQLISCSPFKSRSHFEWNNWTFESLDVKCVAVVSELAVCSWTPERKSRTPHHFLFLLSPLFALFLPPSLTSLHHSACFCFITSLCPPSFTPLSKMAAGLNNTTKLTQFSADCHRSSDVAEVYWSLYFYCCFFLTFKAFWTCAGYFCDEDWK